MTELLTPKQPASAFLESFLEPGIVEAAPYKIDTPAVTIKLDQNESPWDWPAETKRKILDRLGAMAWNRYPGAFTDGLADKVGRYAGVAPGSVLLGPGSNYLVSLALSVFTKGIVKGRTKGKVVVARPSFALYESHLRYEGIPYEPWTLTEDLEYDVGRLPELPDGSVVIFASPNNPVGNVLRHETLAALLTKHPKTLFLADEAYFEYAERPYTDLVAAHANLILIRTFSKTLGCAGVRIGYLVAHPEWLVPLKKLRLPYLLNHFAVAAAEVILEDPATQKHLRQIQQNAVASRQAVYEELRALETRGGFKVKPSEANFLLVRWPTDAAALTAYRKLIDAGILVRNVMAGPGLAGCLRATMGTDEENRALVKAFKGL